MLFRSNRDWLVASFQAAFAVVLVCLLGWLASDIAAGRARQEADRLAAQMAAGDAGLLASEMQKFRLLPAVLSEYPEARTALRQPRSAAARALDRKLEVLASHTDAAVIYLIGLDGVTVAASNWRQPASFVGQDFGFRPYFRDALRQGQAELFALGSVSGRPGMFLSRRIFDRNGPAGVIVAKVEFDRLEREWRRQPGITFVTDRNGVIIITSRQEWRFRTIDALTPPVRAEMEQALQFGRQPLTPLQFVAGKDGDIAIDGVAMRKAFVPSAIENGTLHYFQPLAPIRKAAQNSARAATLGAGLVASLILAFLLWSRFRRLARDEAWRALEAEVAARTVELRDANAELMAESQQRRAADADLRQAQEELARANRLSSLGQITAGVAHEINQPVAAIRTIAENAGQFLQRGNLPRVETALHDIAGMADRIGTITAELRGFASRGRPQVGVLPVDAAIDGSLLILADRFRSGSPRLVRSGHSAGVLVVAERVRLEQVVVNLLQNALDAVEDAESPTIEIRVTASEKHVELEFTDNGPGVHNMLIDDAFTPFVTSKPAGLGLGLGIARDITREFGGTLDLAPSRLGGATFIVRLKRALA